MSDVALEDLADRIRPYVPLCPFETITQALIDVMRDFYNTTRAYQYEVESETVVALVSDYDIELPNSQVEPISIESMVIDAAPCDPKTPAWLSSFLGANWRLREADDFRYFTQLQPKQFTFPCIPQTSGTIGGLSYRVSLRPILTATTIDSVQSDEWLDVWSPGVLAKLKRIPEKQWTDAKGAVDEQRSYLQQRGAARIRVNNAYSNVDQQWANPRGFA